MTRLSRRVPDAILELRGGMEHPAVRKRHFKDPAQIVQQAQPKGELGQKPAHLEPAVAACWDEIVDLCCFGVLSNSDALVVEELAYLLAHVRQRKWDVHHSKLTHLNRCLAVLGMTPADRSRVAVAKDKTLKNPFSVFHSTRAA